MFGWNDEQQMIRKLVRKWVETKLAPANEALESGATLPYDLMRDFAKSFGLADMVRGAFDKLSARADKKDKQGGRQAN